MYCSARLRLPLSTLSNSRVFSNICTFHVAHLQFLRDNASYLRMFEQFSSAAAKDEQSQSFVVSYLVNSCGLTQKRAVSISLTYKSLFEGSEKPNSVLALLRNHGFTDAQVAELISRRPFLLSHYRFPDKTLLPKLKFLYSIGIAKEDLPDFIIKHPMCLVRSLENFTMPLYSFLKSVLHSNEKALTTFRRIGWYRPKDHMKTVCPNIALLKKVGVPESKIKMFLFYRPRCLFTEHVKFRGLVNEVVELRFEASTNLFLHAIYAQWELNRTRRERCLKVYKEWGWSDADMLCAFQKNPLCLLLSEKNLTRILDFLMNKMGVRAGEIAKAPSTLSCSFERVIIRRCSVLKVLVSRGLIKEKWTLNSVLKSPEKYFLKRFVTKYNDSISELLRVYQGEVDPFDKSFSKGHDQALENAFLVQTSNFLSSV